MNEETTTRTNVITISKLWYVTVATELGLDAGLYQERRDDLPFVLPGTSMGSYIFGKVHPCTKMVAGSGIEVEGDTEASTHDLQCQEEQQIL